MPRGIVYAEGKYRARIVSWGLVGVGEKGTPAVRFAIDLLHEIGGDGKPVKCPAFARSITLWLTENAMEYTIEKLVKLGYDRDGIDYLNPEHPRAFSFAGKEVTVSCKHGSYKGEDQENWDFSFGGVVSGPKIENEEIKQLNALFAEKLKGIRKNGAQARPVQQQVSQPAEDVF